MKELLKESPTLAKDACYDLKTMLVFNRWMFQLSGGNRWKLDRVSALNEADESTDGVQHPLPCAPGFHPFWEKFRAAVLAEDAEAVANMTHFPLETSGSKKISRAEFIKRFPRFLNAKTDDYGGKVKTITMKEYIRDTPTLDEPACFLSARTLYFGRWTFHFDEGGRWWLGSIDT